MTAWYALLMACIAILYGLLCFLLIMRVKDPSPLGGTRRHEEDFGKRSKREKKGRDRRRSNPCRIKVEVLHVDCRSLSGAAPETNTGRPWLEAEEVLCRTGKYPESNVELKIPNSVAGLKRVGREKSDERAYGRLLLSSPIKAFFNLKEEDDPGQNVRLRLKQLEEMHGMLSLPGNLPIGSAIPPDVREEVWRREKGKCARCGCRQNLEFHHIIPLSMGGGNTARNIELLCGSCATMMGDTMEWSEIQRSSHRNPV